MAELMTRLFGTFRLGRLTFVNKDLFYAMELQGEYGAIFFFKNSKKAEGHDWIKFYWIVEIDTGSHTDENMI